MRKNAVETVLGAVVLVTALVFLVFALNTAQVRTVDGYKVSAAFFKVGGLTNGSDVRINGIKVGTVSDLNLDAGTFDAVVSMSIRPDVKIPADSIEVRVGTTVRFGTLLIRVTHCDKRPPEETPESTAFLEIAEQRPGEQPVLTFAGWMFASSPALNALEHPVYDVWVLDCKERIQPEN
jgi:phospholipid/cholesterol/gamma-HCH transport system substrate-binding protein